MKKRPDGRYVKVKTINGNKIPFYSRAKSEKLAEKDIENQLLEYKQQEEKGKLYKEVAKEWEREHYKNIEHQTEARYKTLVSHSIDEFGEQYVKLIVAEDIDTFLKGFSTKGYSSKSIKDQYSVLKMILKHAHLKGYIQSLPAFPKAPKGKNSVKREPLNDEQIKIVESSINCTFGFLAYFLLYTGLRKSEALAVQYQDIDLKNNIIHINKALYYKSNEPYIKTPKTEAGKRDVILLDCVADKIQKGKKEDYIFNVNGELIKNSLFTRKWEKYKEETGLKITAHQLRHTFATILFEADINVKDAQSLMGHSDISVTQNIYTHIRQKRLESTAKTLNEHIQKVKK